jgi:iron(III) transport system permease protein
MARPLADPASRSTPIDVVSIAGALMVVALAAFILYPVAAVTVWGLRAWALLGAAAPSRLALVFVSLAVAIASTLAALLPAVPIGYALARVNLPGRTRLWGVCRLGVMLPPFVAPLALLVLAGPQGLLAGVFGAGGALPGIVAIVIGQALGFFPFAVALVVRALAAVPVEMEQAAETLGAGRLTVVRRVTLGLAGPRVGTAALVLVVLCLSDVATPLLLGGDATVLATAVAAAATTSPESASSVALGLALLVGLIGGTWRHGAFLSAPWPALPAVHRAAPAGVHALLAAAVVVLGLALPMLWALVPLGSVLGRGSVSLGAWAAFVTPAGLRPLGLSLALGLGTAVVGATATLIAAWVVGRRRAVLGRGIDGLARVPHAVPGVVAGTGYLLAFGAPATALGTLLLAVVLVACWQLPATLRVAREVLARTDRATEQAAVSLGAGRATVAKLIVLPTLRPITGWIVCDLFAAGILAVGAVIVFGAGLEPGAVTLVTRAAAGATGAACAVATVLLALAGGAVLLGRAIAGRDRGLTLLA